MMPMPNASMRTMREVVRLFALFILTLSAIARDVGDRCILKDGSPATCEHIAVCFSSHDELKKGIKPVICSYSGIFPIVCCGDKKNRPRENDISERMCAKYLQLDVRTTITTTTTTTTTTTSTTTTERNNAGKIVKENSWTPPPITVVGGVNAGFQEFPHMALLGYGTKGNITFKCGGSLISEQFVLTAAHCLESKENGPVSQVRLGDLDIASDFDPAEPQNFNISQTYPHPNYTFVTFYNDIALIKLDRPVVYTKYVKPACIQSKLELDDNHMIATGWGALFSGGFSHSFLQKVEIDSLPIKYCLPTYGPQRILPRGIDEDLQICGGNLQPGKDTCQGDSGGPLQRKIQDYPQVHKIVGITSFGTHCGLVPAIYTRVSKYVSWIESIVWPS